ncbi:MAG TPA: hypothetical protein VFQ23_02385, partial [Anaerolineales bacterium]|nr:hypothetical protein [Anaerolineales bacterium]
ATGLSTGNTQNFTVTPTGGPLKVTLVWSDYPSTESASVNLVNNLDLTVTSGANTYRGNVFSGGWSTTGGTADNRNNVENVYIQSPSGTYTVTVNAFNVPNGPQKFALVVDNGTIAAPPASQNTGLLSPTAQLAATGGDNNGYESGAANAFADGGSEASDTNSGTNKSTSCTDAGKDKHLYYNYNFSFTASQVQGIEVRLDARADASAGAPKLCVEISWNGGTSWTAVKSTPNLSSTQATYILGGAADTWGRTWSTGDFSSGNFRIRVIDVSNNANRDFFLDYLAVRVTYLP